MRTILLSLSLAAIACQGAGPSTTPPAGEADGTIIRVDPVAATRLRARMGGDLASAYGGPRGAAPVEERALKQALHATPGAIPTAVRP